MPHFTHFAPRAHIALKRKYVSGGKPSFLACWCRPCFIRVVAGLTAQPACLIMRKMIVGVVPSVLAIFLALNPVWLYSRLISSLLSFPLIRSCFLNFPARPAQSIKEEVLRRNKAQIAPRVLPWSAAIARAPKPDRYSFTMRSAVKWPRVCRNVDFIAAVTTCGRVIIQQKFSSLLL